jgi:hypothetical protein
MRLNTNEVGMQYLSGLMGFKPDLAVPDGRYGFLRSLPSFNLRGKDVGLAVERLRAQGVPFSLLSKYGDLDTGQDMEG